MNINETFTDFNSRKPDVNLRIIQKSIVAELDCYCSKQLNPSYAS